MKKTFVLTLLFLSMATRIPAEESAIAENVRAHIAYLASDAMQGRLTASPQAKEAASYIFAQFSATGLETRYQTFNGERCRNVVATIPGSSDKYLVLGAHYDAIGAFLGTVHNGADDNASGTAALIEIGRLLAGTTGEYGIMLVAFDAEENGLNGSKYFLDHFQAGQIVLMMSLDMVGHLGDEGRLDYEGTATIEQGAALVKSVKVDGLSVRCFPSAQNSGALTDSFYFSLANIPSFTVTTDLPTSQYHQPSDDLETLDLEGIARVAEHVASLSQTLQGQVVPTGRHLYGNAQPEISLIGAYQFCAMVDPALVKDNYLFGTRLGIEATIPLAYGVFGNLGLGLGLEYEQLFARTSTAELAMHCLTLPVGIVWGAEIGGLGIYYPFGLFYRLVLDGSQTGPGGDFYAAYGRHQAGLDFGLGFRVRNTIEVFNHFGLDLHCRFAIANLEFLGSRELLFVMSPGITLKFSF